MFHPDYPSLIEDRGNGYSFQDLLNQFRSDLDDEDTINQYFTDRQLVNFLVKGIQYVHNNIPFNRKFDYICLKAYQDNYQLPSDFVEAINVFDIPNQIVFDYAKFNQVRSKEGVALYANVYNVSNYKMFQIDEMRRRIYLDQTPDDTTLYTEYDVHIDGTGWLDMPFVSVHDGDANSNWFEPVFVMMANASNQVAYYRVSKVEAGFKGTGTIYWTGTAFTIVGGTTAGMATDSVIDVVYTDSGVVHHEQFTINDPAVSSTQFTVDETPEHNITTPGVNFTIDTDVSTGTALTPVKKLYLTELNINADYPRFATPTHLYLVDYAMEYYALPFISKAGIGTVAMSSTTGTITGDRADRLAVGDYIIIGSETRLIMTVPQTSTYNTFTVDSAFTATITASVYRFIKTSEQLPIPMEMVDLIPLAAMWYAMQRQSDPDLANKYRDELRSQLEASKNKQIGEALRLVSKRVRGFDEEWSRDIPHGV